MVSSSSRLSLLVLELHQIMRITRADCTANREFHPALKTSQFSCAPSIRHPRAVGNPAGHFGSNSETGPGRRGFLFADSAILRDNLTKARDVHAAFCGTTDQELRRPCPAGRGVLYLERGQGGDHRRQRRRQVHPSPPAGGAEEPDGGRYAWTPACGWSTCPRTRCFRGAHRAGAGAAGAERRRPLPGGV